jgi:hypothetical protein
VRRALIGIGVLGCLAGGCGGSGDQHLSRAEVAPLITLANRIAHEDGCGQKRDLAAVRARAVALVNRHSVPSDLQEQLIAGVNDLADRTPHCAPTPPPPATAVRPAPPQPKADERHGHGKGHEKHGHGDGQDERD